MNEFFIILLYEFISNTSHIWINLLLIIIRLIINKIIKSIYVPKTNKLNIQQVVISFNGTIILYSTINLNYYHLKIYLNNLYLTIIGNDKYVFINNFFYKITHQNKNFIVPDIFNIYTLPIIKYDQDECCVCYNNQGSLIGLCGHQNVCIECKEKLSKCPVCNNKNLINFDILNYINLF